MTREEAFQDFIDDMIALERGWLDALELSGLRFAFGDARHHLCHAFVALDGASAESVQIHAREAYLSLLSLGDIVRHAANDCLATPAAAEHGRRGIDLMLDQLEPHVSRADAALRRIALDGVPFEVALATVRDGA